MEAEEVPAAASAGPASPGPALPGQRVSRLRLSALFLLSVTLLGWELAIMRLFAVGSWDNFGSMVISISLLGFGLAGTLLTLIRQRVLTEPGRWLFVTSVLMSPTMALSQVLAQRVPFNPVLIASDSTQAWWLAAYYAIYAVPFFFGALFIGVVFMARSGGMHRLYFWNMLGSGVGGFAILLSMFLLPPAKLILPLLGLASLAALLCAMDSSGRTALPSRSAGKAALTLALLAASFAAVSLWGEIRVSDFKPVSYARRFPDAKEIYHHWSPAGDIEVYDSSFFHFAPGLSDNASIDLPAMPRDAFMGLYIDGNGPIGVMRRLSRGEERYMDYLPMSAPYLLLHRPNVLLLRLGGGIGIFTALYHGARHVDAVEPNPDLIRMLRDSPVLRRFTGDVMADPRVRVINAEPRAYAAAAGRQYDLEEISLIDSVGLSQVGGYPIREDYVYTVQGIRDYMRSLAPDGILSITVWNTVDPPQNVPKLLSTVVEALGKASDAGKRIFAFDLSLSTATILVKRSGFTEKDVARLRDFCSRMSFTVDYYPGMPDPRGQDFRSILAGYQRLYGTGNAAGTAAVAGAASAAAPDAGNLAQMLRDRKLAQKAAGGDSGSAGAEAADPSGYPAASSLYHFALQWLLHGKAAELFKQYVFDIRPATDNRPYYTTYLKLSTIGSMARHIGQIPEMWGQLLLVATLIQSIIFSLLIIAVPVAARWRGTFRRRRGAPGVVIYYGALGLGYMMAEIFLMQRFTFFLADPVYSSSIVLTTMLVVSGIGAVAGSRLPVSRSLRVWIAAGGIALSMLLYIFLLPPLLDAALGLSLAVKILIAVALISPASFFLGIPFPTGLDSLSTNRGDLLPWAWGMNGALSVTGSVFARIVSIASGFDVVLAGVIVIYVVAALTFRANEMPNGLVAPAPAVLSPEK